MTMCMRESRWNDYSSIKLYANFMNWSKMLLPIHTKTQLTTCSQLWVIFKGNKPISWQHCSLKSVADWKKRFVDLESAPQKPSITADVTLLEPDQKYFVAALCHQYSFINCLLVLNFFKSIFNFKFLHNFQVQFYRKSISRSLESSQIHLFIENLNPII